MTENIETMNEKKLTTKVFDFGRNSLYLGLGVVGVAQDNAKGLVKRGRTYRHHLVERGEKMANENRGKVTGLVEKPQAVAKDTAKKAGETLDKYSEQVLVRAHIPTSNQIDSMTKKVTAVDRKLDKVIKENSSVAQLN